MLAWMMYATLAGVLLSVASVLLEQNSPWLAGSRRFLWLVAITGTLCFGVFSMFSPGQRIEPARLKTSVRSQSLELQPLLDAPASTAGAALRRAG